MSTPLKHYGSSEGFTPSTNNRSSTHDFASPQTALTNYTPELVRKPNVDLSTLMGGLGLNATPARHALDDPFVDHAGEGAPFALSATAADYTPVTATPAPRSARSIRHSSSSPATTSSANRAIQGNSVALTSAETTRYVKISGPVMDEAGMTRIKDVKTMEQSIATKKLDDGSLIFRFDHVQDAQVAFNTTRSLFSLGSFDPGWSAAFVPAADFHGDHSRDYEGQLKVAITYHGQAPCTESGLRDIALSTIRAQLTSNHHINGRILSSAVKSFENSEKQPVLYLDVYLASVRAAESLSIKYKHEWKSLPENPDIDLFVEHNCSKYPMSSKPWVSSRSAMALRSSPGHAMTPYSANSAAYMSPNAKDAKVNIKAIENGEDVRTTVMIRNIPNKIDAAMFKTILDEHVFGRYDFSYLRIDFTNNCNVGYAFVNFKNPRDIITLFNGIVDKPWEVFSSDKIADVCYATNQGLGTCIEKFRNSSVMLEWAPHRPKLWYTMEDGAELAGTEKPFPEPSNLQKLHRSRANASSIGLFPPRGVQVSSLGLSPTRGARGDMITFGVPSTYGMQNPMRGSPMMWPIPNHSNGYNSAFAQGSGYPAITHGPMSDQVPAFTGSPAGGRNLMNTPSMNGFGAAAFMSAAPYGYPGSAMQPRF